MPLALVGSIQSPNSESDHSRRYQRRNGSFDWLNIHLNVTISRQRSVVSGTLRYTAQYLHFSESLGLHVVRKGRSLLTTDNISGDPPIGGTSSVTDTRLNQRQAHMNWWSTLDTSIINITNRWGNPSNLHLNCFKMNLITNPLSITSALWNIIFHIMRFTAVIRVELITSSRLVSSLCLSIFNNNALNNFTQVFRSRSSVYV